MAVIASRPCFVGMVQSEIVRPEISEPDSILAAIDRKVDSEAGSDAVSSDSDDDGSGFARNFNIASGKMHGVYMAAPAAAGDGEENPENGEHTPIPDAKAVTGEEQAAVDKEKADDDFPALADLPPDASTPFGKAPSKKSKPPARPDKVDLPPRKLDLPPKAFERGEGSGVDKTMAKKKKSLPHEDQDLVDEYALLHTPIDPNEPQSSWKREGKPW